MLRRLVTEKDESLNMMKFYILMVVSAALMGWMIARGFIS